MTRLGMGVLIWSVVHFLPSLIPDLKKNLVNRLGDYGYKGVFTLLMVAALYLIISGWKVAIPQQLYSPPDWGLQFAFVLVLAGFVLFLAPYPPNNFKRVMRHPQLVGMACWGIGHLAYNGDMRSVVLFGGLATWAVIQMFLLNRRDPTWVQPNNVPLNRDLGLVLFATLVYMTFLYTHHLLFAGTPLT